MDQSFTTYGQQITESYNGLITIHSRGKFTHRDDNKRRKTEEALLSRLSTSTSLRPSGCPPYWSSGPCFKCSKITHCHPGSFLEGIIIKFSNSLSCILCVFSYMLSTMVSINETHFKTTEMNLAYNSKENFSTWIHSCAAVLASYFYGDTLILIQKFF